MSNRPKPEPNEPEPLPMIRRLWTIHDVAEYLCVSTATIYQWRHREQGPPAMRLGKHLRYDPEAVKAWASSQVA